MWKIRSACWRSIGAFFRKSYNLQSLTVGTTEDETVSRMTICVMSDDITFEQIKKQLNRMVEVIKVIDLTNVPIHMKEIYLQSKRRKFRTDRRSISYRAGIQRGCSGYRRRQRDAGMQTDREKNNELIELLNAKFHNIEIVRGGAVAIEAISTSCR
ncbi:hypothetical protein C823_007464 [Eubacterium plexicaudatum ASF492]|nr:hypothetical protein C823_007464 [Eubacterium plexicaudatum ASF492]